MGISEWMFRCWRGRDEAEGSEDLYDPGLAQILDRRPETDEALRLLELFETRYWDFTANHFWGKQVAEHDFKRSYNWAHLTLQGHWKSKPAPRRGAHRRKRQR